MGLIVHSLSKNWFAAQNKMLIIVFNKFLISAISFSGNQSFQVNILWWFLFFQVEVLMRLSKRSVNSFLNQMKFEFCFCNLKYVSPWILGHALKQRRFWNRVTRLPRKVQQCFRWTKKAILTSWKLNFVYSVFLF